MQSYQYARMSSGAWTLLMVAKTGEEFHLEKIRPDIRRLLHISQKLVLIVCTNP